MLRASGTRALPCAEIATVNASLRCTYLPRQRFDLGRANRRLRSRRLRYQEFAVARSRVTSVAEKAISNLLLLPRLVKLKEK